MRVREFGLEAGGQELAGLEHGMEQWSSGRRKFWAVKLYPADLRHAPEVGLEAQVLLRSDPEIVMKIVMEGARLGKAATFCLTASIFSAVKQNLAALRYAPELLRRDQALLGRPPPEGT